jgi:ATP-dependent RNA helicase RhlE
MDFNAFGFEPKLLEGIEATGYNIATPIQEQAIPVILQGKDLIGSAQTGTGKTAAFLLPVIQKIITSPQKYCIKAVIIVPTRELAVQIDRLCQGLSYFTPVSSIPIYGGTDGNAYSHEQIALKEGVDIVICTPGRFISHLNMENVDLSDLKFLILDEADRMLDMGFYEDILKILSFVPKHRQTLMFSATMPHNIRTLARKTLQHPVEINLGVSKPIEKIVQSAYVVYDHQKNQLVKHILNAKQLKSVLVFCSTKQSTKTLAHELKRAGISVAEIHSDLDQQTREETLIRFKNKQLYVLVATDILSRGIDIDDIDMVINFDVPNDGEDYIHRIGRTARAEAEGQAITFINEKEQNDFSKIETLLGYSVNKATVPAEFGEVPEYNPNIVHKKKRNFKKGNFRKKK